LVVVLLLDPSLIETALLYVDFKVTAALELFDEDDNEEPTVVFFEELLLILLKSAEIYFLMLGSADF